MVTMSAKILPGGWLHGCASLSASGAAGEAAAGANKLNTGVGANSEGVLQETENWMIYSSMGAGRIKDEALKEPYRTYCFKPWCTAAVKLYSETELADLAKAPEPGLLFFNGAPVGVSGLPFHVEGGFIADPVDRLVPLTELVTQNRPRQFEITLCAGGWVGAGSGSPRPAPILAGSVLSWNLRLLQTAMEVLAPKLLQELVQGEPSRGPGGSKRTAVAGFYKYWPYLSRMTVQTAQAATRCRMLHSLAALPLFLTRQGFASLDNAILPAWR
jgi:hypothetical protein